jgi:tetratricopeptide (TPR) repeat protein
LRTKVPVAAVCGLACVLATAAMAAGKAGDTTAREAAEPGAAAAPAAAKKKLDPGEAQRAVEHAAKLLEAGKAEQAIQALSTALAAGNLPPAVMAKALFLRGVAYRQQKKPAQAISDFTSALWLKGGLSDSDRNEGLRQRAAAYQEAGLSQGGEATAPALAREARGKERSAAAPPWGDATTTSSPTSALNQEQPKEAASGGGWDLFGNLFGGGNAFAGASPASSSPPAADASQILNGEPARAERAAPPRRAQTSAWSPQTQVEPERSPRLETAAIPAKSDAAPKADTGKRQAALSEAPRSGTHLRIQIGALRTEAEAKALAARVMREHAVALAAHAPQIDQTVMGNMGSFYRVLIGPFANAQETQNLCAKLKGSGIDCLVTAQ